MNDEELEHITSALMPGVRTEPQDYGLLMTMLQERFGIRTLVLHTAGFAACRSQGNHGRWTRALQYGLNLASARALTGRFCRAAEAEELLAGLPLNDQAITVAGKGGAASNLVVVPGRVLRHVKRAVGLGDTFAAGLLIGAAQHTSRQMSQIRRKSHAGHN
jgi:ADP-dependent phosphofructokinase/glucokinase